MLSNLNAPASTVTIDADFEIAAASVFAHVLKSNGYLERTDTKLSVYICHFLEIFTAPIV